MAGIMAKVRMVEEIIPPTIGAAIQLFTSGPVPLVYMMGSSPKMMATAFFALAI